MTPSSSFERILRIEGSHNLRDMGGYRSLDGRQIKWRTLYRSGLMAMLSSTGIAQFRQLGIATIVDLRANRERERRPTLWHQGQGIDYLYRDHELTHGALDELMAKTLSNAEEYKELILAAYGNFPFEQVDSYRTLFRSLIAGRLPLLFNCTAGKDRTGVAAALVLFSLGIPRETIDLDYSLTEHALDKLLGILFSDPRYAALASRPSEHYMPLFAANPIYIGASFQAIERCYGSVSEYLDVVLGVGRAEILALRDILLTHVAT
jgi:protein-tyrosine phosphatase